MVLKPFVRYDLKSGDELMFADVECQFYVQSDDGSNTSSLTASETESESVIPAEEKPLEAEMKQQKSQRVVSSLKDDAVSSDFCHNCINNEKSGDSDSVVPQTNGKVAKIYESSKDGLKVIDVQQGSDFVDDTDSESNEEWKTNSQFGESIAIIGQTPDVNFTQKDKKAAEASKMVLSESILPDESRYENRCKKLSEEKKSEQGAMMFPLQEKSFKDIDSPDTDIPDTLPVEMNYNTLVGVDGSLALSSGQDKEMSVDEKGSPDNWECDEELCSTFQFNVEDLNDSCKADDDSEGISKNSDQHAQKGNGRNMSYSPTKKTDYTEEGQNPCSNAESGSPEKRLQIMPSELVKKCVTFSQVIDDGDDIATQVYTISSPDKSTVKIMAENEKHSKVFPSLPGASISAACIDAVDGVALTSVEDEGYTKNYEPQRDREGLESDADGKFCNIDDVATQICAEEAALDVATQRYVDSTDSDDSVSVLQERKTVQGTRDEVSKDLGTNVCLNDVQEESKGELNGEESSSTEHFVKSFSIRKSSNNEDLDADTIATQRYGMICETETYLDNPNENKTKIKGQGIPPPKEDRFIEEEKQELVERSNSAMNANRETTKVTSKTVGQVDSMEKNSLMEEKLQGSENEGNISKKYSFRKSEKDIHKVLKRKNTQHLNEVNSSKTSTVKEIKENKNYVTKTNFLSSDPTKMLQKLSESSSSSELSGKCKETLSKRKKKNTNASEVLQNISPKDQIENLSSKKIRRSTRRMQNGENAVQLGNLESKSESNHEVNCNTKSRDNTNVVSTAKSSIRKVTVKSSKSQKTENSGLATQKSNILSKKERNSSINSNSEFDSSPKKSMSKKRLTMSKPKVAFTGMSDKNMEKIVNDMNGEVVNNIREATHLVTDKVRRTVKFLCAVSRGIPILGPEWLNSVKSSNMFTSWKSHTLQDHIAEKKYKFQLAKSLEKACVYPLLKDYEIYVTKSVKPEPKNMKEIIECSGGKFLTKVPKSPSEKVMILSCDEDENIYEKFVNRGFTICTSELLLTGILKQELEVDVFSLGNIRKDGAETTAETQKPNIDLYSNKNLLKRKSCDNKKVDSKRRKRR